MSQGTGDVPAGPGAPTDPGLRLLARVVAIGSVVGVLLALLVGLLGGTGRAGAAVLVLVLALTAALVGAVGVASMVIDERRGRPVSTARIVAAVAGFLGATLLMAMLVGIGG